MLIASPLPLGYKPLRAGIFVCLVHCSVLVTSTAPGLHWPSVNIWVVVDGWINVPTYPLSQGGAFMPTLSIFAGPPLGVDRLMNLAPSPAGQLEIQCRMGSKTQE